MKSTALNNNFIIWRMNMPFSTIAIILMSWTENHHDKAAYNKKICGDQKNITYVAVYDINNQFTEGLISLSIKRNNRWVHQNIWFRM